MKGGGPGIDNHFWALPNIGGTLDVVIDLISYRFRMDFGRIWGGFWWILGKFKQDF